MQGRPYNKREERAMVRQMRLRELGYDTYAAYLKSVAWRDLTARYRASDLPQICMCGDTKVQLHHTTYERVGRELLEDLIPLCEACHAQAHILEAEGIIELDLKGFYYDAERALVNQQRELIRRTHAADEHGVGAYDRQMLATQHAVARAAATPRGKRRTERGRIGARRS